ncbi:lipid-A-disaccharide synthase [filamentous cyanobacterium CCP5]|nr:lipid-A-disaccharide synthase [filamentous cyanobacterium CCP5]
MADLDVLILSNGPGEVSTWVRPVVAALRRRLPDSEQMRISVVLSPCANASGREAAIAASFPGVNRVQGPEQFFRFLLTGKTAEGWDWRPEGVVVFLGGDQVYPLIISKRLGYRSVIYAEWDARWHRWIDAFGCMTPEILDQVKPAQRHKFQVIGDLMADVDSQVNSSVAKQLDLAPDTELIGMMPGSKKNKLGLGVPFLLAVADHIRRDRPQAKFVIPVAPMLSLEAIAAYGDPAQNPDMAYIEGSSGTLVLDKEMPKLRTPAGTDILLWQAHPAYDLMGQFDFCLTTIGANTAELGSLGVPMMVLIPSQKLDVMKAWDGIPGILANLPLVGSGFAKLINRLVLQTIFKEGKLFAWPNIWAGKEIVPERLGRITPTEIAAEVVNYLQHPDQLEAMQQNLRAVRGQAGAADKLVDLILGSGSAKKFFPENKPD